MSKKLNAVMPPAAVVVVAIVVAVAVVETDAGRDAMAIVAVVTGQVAAIANAATDLLERRMNERAVS